MTAFDFDRIPARRDSDSNKWRKFPPDVLPLWVADMDFQSPPAVVAALRARVEHGYFGYLTETPELREVVAERLAKRFGWRVEPEAVVPVPGVNSGVNLAVRAVTQAGDGVLVQTPLYPPLLRAAENHGTTRHVQLLARQPDGRYAVDAAVFAGAIRPETRAFILCNPHNPVGRLFERPELEAMATACLRRELWIIADEVHSDLVFDGRSHVPMATLSPDVEQRTITFVAPSKTFNLPGLKCAVAVVPNRTLRERLTAAAADLVPKINVLGHTAAVAAYRDGDAWLQSLLHYLEGNRDFVAREVTRRLPGVRLGIPDATSLAWLDCRETGLADPYTFFLEQAKVALNDGTLFGPGGEGFVRLNFGCPRPLLADALARMAAALERHHAAEAR